MECRVGGVAPGVRGAWLVAALVVSILGGCTTSFDPADLPVRPPDAGIDANLPDAGPTGCGTMFALCCDADAGAPCAAGLVCTGLYCQGCPSSTRACGTSCQDIQFNPRHCGSCSTACAAQQSCMSGRCVTPCPTGQTGCGTDCVVVASDPTHCGACDNRCTAAHAQATCAAGACGLGSCDAGWGNCDAQAANGCETNLQSSPTNCAACGHACTFPHAFASCVSGGCQPGACESGWGNCDGMAANGCEADLTSSGANCGACGAACSFAHAGGSCAGGACVLGACAAGFADCDGMPANGCETDTTASARNCGACGMECPAGQRCSASRCVTSTVCTDPTTADCTGSGVCSVNLTIDPANCGGCGVACALPHSAPTCVGGVCATGTCDPGYGHCSSDPTAGCETNLQTSVTHCGGCTHPCTFAHASAGCMAGVCQLGACDSGWGNCDGDAANGCEADLTTSVGNCGACGSTCSAANADATCMGGTCQRGACNPGFADCDGLPGNGCETNTGASPRNCGACGNVCAFANAAAGCSAGACQLGMCAAGYADCDGLASTGCETAVTADVSNCGACRFACTFANATAVCTAGACAVAACNPGYAHCTARPQDGCETSVNTDPTNCGMCGTRCGVGQLCSGGRCVTSCPPGQTACGESCVDERTNVANCGACGHACPMAANATPTCTLGACAIACSSGYADCNGSSTDGCETALQSSVTNCGACGVACPSPANATPACSAGRCAFGCLPGFADCNGNASDGCEIDLRANPLHCGGCATSCPTPPHASATCTTGVCGYTCAPGYGDCDGNAANGCETPLTSNVYHCGSCATRCWYPNAAAMCTAGVCQMGACAGPYADCDHSSTNGCETNTRGNVLNCGACGVSCATTAANAHGACTSMGGGGGTCAYACNAGYSDCRRGVTSGCTTDLRQPSTCGRCNDNCGSVLAGLCATDYSVCTAVCLGGTTCGATCANLLTDIANCGACGNQCTAGGGAAPTCSHGTCSVVCPPGFNNCDGMAANGCESDLRTDSANCGSCGLRCATGQYCAGAGQCCPLDQVVCGTSCVDLGFDVNNCGRCSNRCTGPGAACVNGMCTGT